MVQCVYLPTGGDRALTFRGEPPRARWQPYIENGTWLQRHPTRYSWRRYDIRNLIQRLYDNFDGISINTYVNHPEPYWRDTTSFDVWHSNGRGVPIAKSTGDAVVSYIFNDPNPPWIEWCIWYGRIWIDDGQGWRTWWDDGTGAHTDHPHFTFWEN